MDDAPPPYDGTMSDPLASPSQSQTLNAARLARLRTAGRRAADAEPAAPAAPPIADVAALDARAEELLRRCDSLLARTQPPAPPEPEPEPEPEPPAAVDPIASDAAAVVDLISEVVIGGFSPRASAYSSPPASPQRLPARSPARTPPASPLRSPPRSPARAPASPPRQLPPRVPPGEVEALRRRAAPHASDSVVKTLLARIAAVEGKLGGVDAGAARRPLIEDRFVF